MKQIACFTFLLVLLAFSGCNRKSKEESPEQHSEIGRVTAEDLGKEIGDVLDTAAKLAADEKKNYAQKTSENLKSLQKQLDEMKPKIRKMSRDGREQAEQTMEEIQRSIDSIAETLKKEMESEKGFLKSAARELQNSLEDLQNTAGKKLTEIGKALEKDTQKAPTESPRP